MTLEETLQLVNPLVDAGVDALHISAGIGETQAPHLSALLYA